VENVLDEHEKKFEKVQSSSPFNAKRVMSIDLTVQCYSQELGNHFPISGRFGLIASLSSFSIFEVGDHSGILTRIPAIFKTRSGSE